MTPHELNVRITEFRRRQNDELLKEQALCYAGALLTRLEKFPMFEKFFEKTNEINKPKRTQTPEEMMAVMAGINK